MITELLEDHIQVKDSVDSWQASVEIAADKLVAKDYITENYVKTAIENITKNGPYVVVMPKVAIPHARPDAGVNKTTFSILKLNKPVMYPEEKAVQLVLMLAAADSKKHLKLISSLTDLFSDDEKMEQIFAATSAEEILKIIQ